jgi:hypothetical protein
MSLQLTRLAKSPLRQQRRRTPKRNLRSCYGNGRPDDLNLLADIVTVDGGVVRWLHQHRGAKNGDAARNRLTPATLPPSDAEKLKLFDAST